MTEALRRAFLGLKWTANTVIAKDDPIPIQSWIDLSFFAGNPFHSLHQPDARGQQDG